eukprot:SM000166S02500  [mRNA]  locus=s166:224172:225411:+ [translate_table: standard]
MDEAAWALYMLFPKLVLGHLPSFGVGGRKTFQDRLAAFASGKWEELSTAGYLARARRFGRAGEVSRAAQALCPDPLATTNDATEAILPPPPSTTPLEPWDGELPNPLDLSAEALRVALTKAPRMMSGGPSGWLFEHLQDLFLDGDERSFSLFLSTCRHIARAAIPPRIAAALNSSHLLALAKPTGGVRPIAMTEVVMRLVSKA